MGFFKKIFKGIKKVFKKIGKAVKSVFKKVGKFMGKIGIVGQLGLALIMPYALPALGGLATGMMGTQLGGALGAVVKGAGHFLNAAVKVGTRVGSAFKSVTSAVTKTLGNMVGATINSIPGGKAFGGFMKELTGGMIDITGKNFSTAWDATQKAWSQAGSDLGQLFSKSTIDSSMNKFGIEASLEKTVGGEFDTSRISYDPVTGKTTIGVDRATGTLGNQGVGIDVADSLGLGTPGRTYSATALPLGTDEALFTVGGTDPTSSLLSSAPLKGAALQTSDIAMATRPAAADPFFSTSGAVDVSSYTPDASKVATEFDEFTNISKGVVPTAKKSLAAQAGERGKEFLKSQGYEMSLMGAAKVADELAAGKEQQEFMQSIKDPFAFVDMSYLTPQPIQSSPGLSTTGLTPASGWDYFTQLQDEILNSDYTSMYSQGYYGAPSLQAGLAMAYEELAQ
jgi:hypothetical protein